MTWQNGQRLERHEVEHWIGEAYSYPYFKVSAVEREEPQHSRIRITMTVTGPNAEPIVAKERTAVYYALRDLPGMPQIAAEFVT